MKNQFTVLLILVSSAFTLLNAQEFENGLIGISINNAGRVRIHAPAVDATRQIDRFSFLAGVARDQVYDYRNDGDAVDSAVTVENPSNSDFEVYVKVNNSYSNLPPNFEIAINVYGWNDQSFALAKYEITNKESDNLETTFGFEILPQIDGAYGLESIIFDSESEIIKIRQSAFSTKVGIKTLNENISTLFSTDWFEGYELGDTLLWDWMSSGNINGNYSSGADGSVNIVGFSPRTVALDETVQFWVAMAVGATDDEIKQGINSASAEYQALTDVEELNNELPVSYNLNQNYPNPFNPLTNIQFSIPEKGFVTLAVFNSLGQTVRTLVKNDLNQGNYNVEFDASSLPSGVYYYKLEVMDFVETKKMILLK